MFIFTFQGHPKVKDKMAGNNHTGNGIFSPAIAINFRFYKKVSLESNEVPHFE